MKNYPAIDIHKFEQITLNTNINGKIFIKGNPEFKTSVQFGKLFKSVGGYKKKHFGKIYTTMKTGNWVVTTTDIIKQNKQSEMKEEEEKDITKVDCNVEVEEKTDNKDAEIYNLGTRFYFWNSMKKHPHYIKRKYLNLK
eukprot:224757_1